MPTIPKFPGLDQLSGWLREDPSVFDAPGEELARKAGRFVGLDDPNQAVTSLMNPNPVGPTSMPLAGLITIFKNRLAREGATDAYVMAAQKHLPPAYAQAAAEFAERYPRIAAHTAPKMGEVPAGQQSWWDPRQAVGYASMPPGRVRERVEMGITPFGAERNADDIDAARRTIFHEGTHVAQSLGNRHANQLYQLANKVKGYFRNPFEESARESAERNVQRLAGDEVSLPAVGGKSIDRMREAAEPGMLDFPEKKRVKGLMNALLDYRQSPAARSR